MEHVRTMRTHKKKLAEASFLKNWYFISYWKPHSHSIING
jgi:hypothetical protein